MKNFKIVADSSADTYLIDGVNYSSVPLKIRTNEVEFIDTADLDTLKMTTMLKTYSGKSGTACPSVQDWLDAFEGAEEIFCLTITSHLSGSYNSALIAKEDYKAKNPDAKVYVIDTLSTGPEMKVIIDKIIEFKNNGLEFSQICKEIDIYMQSTALIFMLESMRNLANNGRVSPLKAKAAGILGIRVVGKASDEGELEILEKVRGENKTYISIVENMKNIGFSGGKVIIDHCHNESAAESVKNIILSQFPAANIEIRLCGGLCSFYAESGGLLVGFEK